MSSILPTLGFATPPQTYYTFDKPTNRPFVTVATNSQDGDFGPFTPGTQTAGIQEAINALPIGGSIYIKQGHYFINNAITLANNIRIVGEGYGHEAGNWNVLLEQNYNGDIFQIGNSIFPHIERLTLHGGKGTFSSGNGINFNSPNFIGYYSVVRDVYISNFPQTGLIIQGNSPTEVRCINVLSNNNGQSGFIDIGGGNHRFIECVAGNNTYNGFEIKGNGSHYVGCVAWSNHVYGFYILGKVNKIIGQAYDSSQAGVELEAVPGLTPVQNEIDIHSFDNNTGFLIKGGTNNVIKGLATQITSGLQPTGVSIQGGSSNILYIESFLNGTTDWNITGGTYILRARSYQFKTANLNVSIGTNSVYGGVSTITSPSGVIALPRIKITWGGVFGSGETVTVQITAVYTDGTTTSITKSATATGSLWLTDDDVFALLTQGKDITNLNLQAQTNLASTTVTVTVNAYGKG